MAHTFPVEIYQQLDGYDFRILNEIAFLSKQQKRRTGSAYCCPGREYLAGKVGCDIWTISRHTSKLERLGILIKKQRRPIRGIYQTCLYKLVKWTSWALAGIAGQLRKEGTLLKHSKTTASQNNRVRPDTPIVSEYRNRIPKTGVKHDMPVSPITDSFVADILKRWEERGNSGK